MRRTDLGDGDGSSDGEGTLVLLGFLALGLGFRLGGCVDVGDGEQ